MHLIKLLDDKNYTSDLPVFHRDASRAIILRDGKLAMVHSLEEGYYEFPGGGVEAGESLVDAAIRETEEEVGLRVIRESVREYGYIIERRHGHREDAIFEMNSYYFLADVEDVVADNELCEREASLGYVLEWVEPKKAYEANISLSDSVGGTFLLRETEVLREIIEKLAENP